MRAALVLLVLSASSAALANAEESAAQARAAEEALDYDVANDLWMTVIGADDASEELLREAHLRSGVLQRIRGNDTAARLHFRYVLTRDPNHALPEGTPPKVSGFFELVREEVRVEQDAARPTPPPVDMRARAAPKPEEPGPPVLAWAEAGTGGLLLVGAVVSIGVGGVFGVLAGDANTSAGQETTQPAAAALYAARDQHALTANVLYGVGGGAAVVGAVLLGLGLWGSL